MLISRESVCAVVFVHVHTYSMNFLAYGCESCYLLGLNSMKYSTQYLACGQGSILLNTCEIMVGSRCSVLFMSACIPLNYLYINNYSFYSACASLIVCGSFVWVHISLELVQYASSGVKKLNKIEVVDRYLNLMLKQVGQE